MKEAMKLKDKVTLETLRAVKAELLKIQTASGASSEISRAEEIKLLQKMQKQRKDAFAIYEEQGRKDLAEEELAQLLLAEEVGHEALRVVVHCPCILIVCHHGR